jgi:glutathione peroxidase
MVAWGDDPKPAPANQPTPAQEPVQSPAPAPAQAPAPAVVPDQKPAPVSPYVLDHTMKSIDSSDVQLADYKGKVVLMVNVASKCGFTGQYKGLEELYQLKKEQGLVILGFPANNFGSQEPGTNAEIKAFCTSKYSVTFPMFAKVSVKGDDQCELYKQLASQPAPIGGDPGWNFTKFLVDREGNVVERYDSRVRPNDPQLMTRLDELLGTDASSGSRAPAETPKASPGG